MGGKVTLCKSVLGSIPLYFLSLFKAPLKVLDSLESIRRKFIWGKSENGNAKISWVNWQKTIAPKALGGLGIGSLKSANWALLIKWWWRYKREVDALWRKVIKAIHGEDNNDPARIANNKHAGVWLNIFKSGEALGGINLNIDDLIVRKVGNGQKIMFWNEKWLGLGKLKTLFPDLFRLEPNKSCTMADRITVNTNGDVTWNWPWNAHTLSGPAALQFGDMMIALDRVNLSNEEDQWSWEGHPSGVFSVRSLRTIIDSRINSPFAGYIYWNNWLPSRVNCFMWRLLLNRIPTKPNLISRGVILLSEDCYICNNQSESVDHLFLSCPAVMEVWSWFNKWCNLNINTGGSYSLEQFMFKVVDKGSSSNQKKFLEAAVGCTCWFIWKARNEWVFNRKKFSASWIVDEIQSSLFTWVKIRAKCNVMWANWCCNPTLCF